MVTIGSYLLLEKGGKGVLLEKLGEGKFLDTLAQFQTKICNFFPPFPNLTQNVMPYFRQYGASKKNSVPILFHFKSAKIYILVPTKTAEKTYPLVPNNPK